MKLIYSALLLAAVSSLAQPAFSATKRSLRGQSKYINGVKWHYSCWPASWIVPCYQNEGSFTIHIGCDEVGDGHMEPAKCEWEPEEPVHPDYANSPR